MKNAAAGLQVESKGQNRKRSLVVQKPNNISTVLQDQTKLKHAHIKGKLLIKDSRAQTILQSGLILGITTLLQTA